jgi:hypothetical protein
VMLWQRIRKRNSRCKPDVFTTASGQGKLDGGLNKIKNGSGGNLEIYQLAHQNRRCISILRSLGRTTNAETEASPTRQIISKSTISIHDKI